MTVHIAFLGNDPWSVPPLQALVASAGVAVDLVLTNPPRPARRGSKLTPTAVADAAGRLGLQIVEVDGLGDGAGVAALDAAAPDALVVVAYGEILSADVLDLPRLGSLNLHFSLLPRWRGAAPVQRAILDGDVATGVTVMLMDEGLDTGPVIAQHEEPIRDDDDAGGLGLRLATIGGAMLAIALADLEAGTASPVPQDHSAASVAAKIKPQERWIDWGRPVKAIDRRIRALAPRPGALTTWRGAPLKVQRAAPERAGLVPNGAPDPGMPRISGDGDVSVDAADGSLRLLEVAPAGRNRMSAAAWARGARLRPGERFG